MVGVDFVHTPGLPTRIWVPSTESRASENSIEILTFLSTDRSGTMLIEVAVGRAVSITTPERAVALVAV